MKPRHTPTKTLLVFTIVIWFCSALNGFSAINIVADNVSATTTTSLKTGTFDIYVRHDEASSPEVIDFTVTLLSATPGIRFTGVSVPVHRPYVLSLQGGIAVEAGGFFGATLSNDGHVIKGGDSGFLDGERLDDGDALLSVHFAIEADLATGVYEIAFERGPNETFLSSASGDLSVAFQNGSIAVVSVPEPQSACLLIMATALGFFSSIRGFRWRYAVTRYSHPAPLDSNDVAR